MFSLDCLIRLQPSEPKGMQFRHSCYMLEVFYSIKQEHAIICFICSCTVAICCITKTYFLQYFRCCSYFSSEEK